MLRWLTSRHTFAHVNLSCGATRLIVHGRTHSPPGDCFCSSQPVMHWVSWTHLINLFLLMQRIQSRTSDACTCVYVSLLKGTALVVFKNGGTYHYRNVSRRAIANLLLNPNMSLGFWVNNNCLTERAQVGQRWNAAPCVG